MLALIGGIAALVLVLVVAEAKAIIHIQGGIAELSANQDKIDAAAAAITAAASAIQGAIEPLNFDGLDAAVSGLQAIVPAPADPNPPSA